jgi:hypothetical protein
VSSTVLCIHDRLVATGDGFGCPECFAPRLALARAARDRGMAAAEAGRGADWDRKVIDRAIAHLAATRQEFSANEVRELLPVVSGALIGSRFMAAYRRGDIERIGDVFATHAEGHGRRISLWRKAR